MRALLSVAVAWGGALQPLNSQVVPDLPPPGEELYEFELLDGSEFVARVLEVGASSIVLITPGGTRIEVDTAQIRAFRLAEGRLVEGEFWGADPNPTRLFFTSTGRTLQEGEAYVGTYLFVMPFVAVGVTDRLTLSVGAPVVVGSLEPFYFAPKLQVASTEAAALSLGSLFVVWDGDGGPETVGVAYGVGTFGSLDHALTLGLGFGFAGSDFSSQPVAMIGGETRVGRRTKLVTENYFLPGETGVVYSGGLRFMGSRFATDVGAAGFVGGGEGGCCLPLLNFSYSFGRSR
jgi:hypothetical protein